MDLAPGDLIRFRHLVNIFVDPDDCVLYVPNDDVIVSKYDVLRIYGLINLDANWSKFVGNKDIAMIVSIDHPIEDLCIPPLSPFLVCDQVRYGFLLADGRICYASIPYENNGYFASSIERVS